jgi:hypothetical protein
MIKYEELFESLRQSMDSQVKGINSFFEQIINEEIGIAVNRSQPDSYHDEIYIYQKKGNHRIMEGNGEHQRVQPSSAGSLWNLCESGAE